MNKPALRLLEEIAGRLCDGQASLFVGAGFSKNAQRAAGGRVPPSWDELGDLFFNKTRKIEPTDKDRAYANVLRLAEEVENTYRRGELIRIIRDAINDDLLSPSDLHMQMLALPWNDVYTTNYDTLLDRTALQLEKQGLRSYSLIQSGEDIGLKSSPLLIKLHGDINKPSSIVITEEDYRKYPDRHKAMIGHIQHTIMTKTLVLVGFSGNDPNFLQWLGWVKDALKKRQRKVYLLSLEELSEATRSTFYKKNVVVVSIKSLAGDNASDYDNVAAAIKYLEDYLKKREEEKEKYWNVALSWGRNSNRDEDINTTYNRWKKEYDSYPGWLVLPREKREYLASMEGFSLAQDKLSRLRGTKDILFLDLYNWRIEKCLYPIENEWENSYLKILDKYKRPSSRKSDAVSRAWLNLKFGLLRLYRQEGWKMKWTAICDELSPLVEMMDDEQRCRYEYERAMEAVYNNDYSLLRVILENWGKAKSDLYWDIRRGALWAEYLSLNKGKEITQTAFESICKKLDNSKQENERYYWGSRKVYAHTVLECMAQANFNDGSEEVASARRTWLELRPYDDIWYERDFFESHLRPVEAVLKVRSQKAAFQLGYSTTSTNLSGNSKDYRIAYAFFLYYEEIGFPVHLPYLSTIEKSSLEKALSIMAFCSPAIAQCWALRVGDSKIIPAVYNRKYLNQAKTEDVNSLFDHYLECFNRLLISDSGENAPSWVLAFKNVIPEILSRLCMKASVESRIKVLDCVDVIFREKESFRYDGIDRLLSSLMASFSEDEIAGLIPKLASMSIANDRYGDCRYEPMFYIGAPYKVRTRVSSIVSALLARLEQNEKGEKAILYRLLFLWRCHVLSDAQQKRLGEMLWSNRDANGFPERTIFMLHSFLSFPHPDGVNPAALLSDYFKKQPLPIVGQGSMVSFYGGHLPIFREYMGTINKDSDFVWDAELLNVVCMKLVKMWDSDKGRLQESDQFIMGFSLNSELRDRFEDVERVVSAVIAPHRHLLYESNRLELIRLSKEYETYGIPSFRMRLALADLSAWRNEVLTRLSSSDSRVVDDCILGIKLLFERGIDVMEYVRQISENFRCNAEAGRNATISGLCYFVKQTAFINSETFRTNILLGLDHLFVATVIDNIDDELTVNNKMNLRRLVVPIVKSLLDYYAEVPSSLSKWCDYYVDQETCHDIKNRFLDD